MVPCRNLAMESPRLQTLRIWGKVLIHGSRHKQVVQEKFLVAVVFQEVVVVVDDDDDDDDEFSRLECPRQR
eukprot:5774690-Amphidinium_carterae.1